jgi:uncharacterized membrane protein YdjX (TVP38/TMEM64 family)
VNDLRLRIAAIVLVVAGLALIASLLPAREFIQSALDWTHGGGVWSPLVLVLGYVAACVLFIPGLLLSIGAGFLFGVGVGTITASLGSTLGATIAFLIGRMFARGAVARMIAGSDRFAAIDAAVGREGFKVVLLARLSPVLPFNVLNYAFGLTDIRTRDYVLASWIGMLPGTVMYVTIGSTLASLAEVGAGAGESGTARRVLLIVGLAATVALVYFSARLARGALREVVKRPAVEDTTRTETGRR